MLAITIVIDYWHEQEEKNENNLIVESLLVLFVNNLPKNWVNSLFSSVVALTWKGNLID